METRTIEIGYVLKGYPRTSETFIINEIFLLEREQHTGWARQAMAQAGAAA